MAYEKRWFVSEAFSEIGMADYAFDLQPEQWQTGLTILDSMMAQLDGQGIRLGWSIPNSPEDSTLDDEVDVPYQSRAGIYFQLALRLAKRFGKAITPELKQNAKDGMDSILLLTSAPTPMQFPSTMPSGAGNKPWRNNDSPFLGPPTDFVDAGGDGPLDFGTLQNQNVNSGSP